MLDHFLSFLIFLNTIVELSAHRMEYYYCSNKLDAKVDDNALCDGVTDCEGGTDEAIELCLYKFWKPSSASTDLMKSTITQMSDAYSVQMSNISCCSKYKYPPWSQTCECSWTHLRCYGIPRQLSIRGNCIRYITVDSSEMCGNLSKYLSLSKKEAYYYVSLQRNFLTTLSTVFHEISTWILRVDINSITVFKRNYFQGSNIKCLWMTYNRIKTIEAFAVKSITNIELLSLAHNEISEIRFSSFASNSLIILLLEYNQIRKLRGTAFGRLPRLEDLNLRRNRIVEVDRNFFRNTPALKHLDLSYNRLLALPSVMSVHLKSLKSLNLQGNHLLTILHSSYFPPSLQYLCLLELNIQNTHFSLYHKLQNLTTIMFNDPSNCLFVAQYGRCVGIAGTTYVFLSPRALVESIALRILIMIYVLLLFATNTALLISINLHSIGPIGQRILVSNLCIANALMSVYLVTLNVKNMQYSRNFSAEAVAWMYSPLCQVIGIIANVSCEVSVFIICIISLQRMYLLKYPFEQNPWSSSGKSSLLILFIIWASCLLSALLPLLLWKQPYYGSSLVCFPLFLHSPRTPGWQFSCFLFLVNCLLTGAVILSTIQIIITYVARKERLDLSRRSSSLRKSLSSAESFSRRSTFISLLNDEFTLKLLFVVLVKVAWWTPLFILKVFSLTGGVMKIHLDSMIVLLLIPIPNFLIPISLLASTDKFRFCFRPLYGLISKLTFSKTISTETSLRLRSQSVFDKKGAQSEMLESVSPYRISGIDTGSSPSNSIYIEPVEVKQTTDWTIFRRIIPHNEENDDITAHKSEGTSSFIDNTSNNSNLRLKLL